MIGLDFAQNIFLVVGGLGLFLYGMKILAGGLETIAGNRMRSILERATSNRLLGIAVGASATAVIQSSTALTVMVVGFINAGLMNLTQAISLIMGAGIGTTLTAHIISFRIDAFAPLFIFFGLLLYMFSRRKKIKDAGYISLCIGILFFGLSVMGGPLKEFAQEPGFQAMLTAFRNPALAVLTGFLFTAVIQSSTAATGILVTMYLSGIDLHFTTAAFIVLGINAGTTITALLASLAAGKESKRAALAYLFIKSVSCTFYGLLILTFPGILMWFENTWYDGARQIAMFHTAFNFGMVLLFVPFTNHVSALMYKIIPKRDDENEKSKQLQYIKAEGTQSAEATLAQAHAELSRMGKMTLENLRLALDAFYNADADKAATVLETDDTIDFLDREITSWLAHIKNVEEWDDMERLSALLYISSNLERIGDHAVNIAEYASLQGNRRRDMHSAPRNYLHVLSETVVEMVELALNVFDSHDSDVVGHIVKLEEQANLLSRQCIEKYIERQENEVRDPRGGIILTSIVGDLERCGDHVVNIVQFLQGQK